MFDTSQGNVAEFLIDFLFSNSKLRDQMSTFCEDAIKNRGGMLKFLSSTDENLLDEEILILLSESLNED